MSKFGSDEHEDESDAPTRIWQRSFMSAIVDVRRNTSVMLIEQVVFGALVQLEPVWSSRVLDRGTSVVSTALDAEIENSDLENFFR